MALSHYKGSFGVPQAERLLFRAGFGPRPGEAQALAKLGLEQAVRSLIHPQPLRLEGPAPADKEGNPLAPTDAWGHDQAWWLDQMVRSNQPLIERMTLIWHDWFATSQSGVGDQKLMIRQNKLFRLHALGNFKTLILEITRDPAMLMWLSGNQNNKWSPNENYARELMELFTLGAGRGYTEQDVREMARALTGFRNDWRDSGAYNFRFDRSFHDNGVKKIFKKRGRFNWRGAVGLCLKHPKHPSFFVTKLWSYFIPTPPSASTRKALEKLYVKNRYKILPVVEAILKSPEFYEGPSQVKPPIVYIAGLLRARNRYIDTTDWAWISELAGQSLFHPPNVAGWDDEAWLNTGSWRGRWIAANTAIGKAEELNPNTTEWDITETPEAAVKKALDFWGNPTLSAATLNLLNNFAKDSDKLATKEWKRHSYPILRQNALRMLIATSPDFQTC